MRAIPFAIVLALALASAGCPDSLQGCPSNSLPSGSFHLTLTLQHTSDECIQLRQPDGGPPPADGSIVPASQPVESILCAGLADAGAPTLYLVVANSSVVRNSPFDPDGGFTFVSEPLRQAQTLCNCLADVHETISGVLLGGGATGFSLGPDGGLVPQPTGIDGSVQQTLDNPNGNCVCQLPCAEHFTLAGAPNR